VYGKEYYFDVALILRNPKTMKKLDIVSQVVSKCWMIKIVFLMFQTMRSQLQDYRFYDWIGMLKAGYTLKSGFYFWQTSFEI